MSERSEFPIDLEQDVKDLFRRKTEEFLRFCKDHWQITDADHEALFSDKSPDFRAGYNAALTDGLTGALECWFEEIGYG